MLINKIKKAGKNLLASTVLVATLFCGSQAQAQDNNQTLEKVIQEKPSMPSRTLFFYMADFNIDSNLMTQRSPWASPLNDYETNTKAWYSTTQVLGKSSDLLGIKLDFDKNIFGRITQVAALGYLNEAASYYFHEMAHDFEARKIGFDNANPRLDFSDWHRGFPEYIPAEYTPNLRNQKALCKLGRKERKELQIKTVANGLNQEEVQAKILYEIQNEKNRILFDEALSFIFTKTADQVYMTIRNSLAGHGVVKKIDYKSIYSKYGTSNSLESRNLINDIDEYLYHLHRFGIERINSRYLPHPCAPPNTPGSVPMAAWNPQAKGIELTKKQLLTQFIAADVLSLRTWESFYAIGNYLATGERSIEPITFKLGETEITPPVISHYLTPKGSFYDSNTDINLAGKLPLEINLGTDIDNLLGPGKVKHIRTGIQLNLSHKNAINLRPFVHLNFDRHGAKYAGYSTGIEFSMGSPNVFEIILKLEQNENDLIENTVKGKPEGLNVAAGLRIEY